MLRNVHVPMENKKAPAFAGAFSRSWQGVLKDKLNITFHEDEKQALIDKYLEQDLSFNEETVEFEPFEMSRDGAICSVRIYPQKVSGKLVLGIGQNMIPTVYASHKHEQ